MICERSEFWWGYMMHSGTDWTVPHVEHYPKQTLPLLLGTNKVKSDIFTCRSHRRKLNARNENWSKHHIVHGLDCRGYKYFRVVLLDSSTEHEIYSLRLTWG